MPHRDYNELQLPQQSRRSGSSGDRAPPPGRADDTDEPRRRLPKPAPGKIPARPASAGISRSEATPCTRHRQCAVRGRMSPGCGPGSTAFTYPVLQFHPYCRCELAVSRRGPNEVPFVAGNVGEHSDVAIGFGARCGEKLHTRRCHPRAGGVEVLDMEEETHPPGGLLPDDGGLVISVSPGEQHAGRRTRRPDYYPPLGMPVISSSASSKPSPSTKKLRAASYSRTTMAMRPRRTAPHRRRAWLEPDDATQPAPPPIARHARSGMSAHSRT